MAEAKFCLIGIDPGKKHFVDSSTGAAFVPWGFNYDRDNDSHLLEEDWDKEWPRVVEDFGEIKSLGANVVRVHLQLAKFLDAPDRINEANFKQLERLVRLAEHLAIRLDLTGLACYRKSDVPAWYDELPESKRWDAQARFWDGWPLHRHRHAMTAGRMKDPEEASRADQCSPHWHAS